MNRKIKSYGTKLGFPIIGLTFFICHNANGEAMKLLTPSEQTSVPGPTANFSGAVRVTPLFGPENPSNLSSGSVTFQAGARSAWHTHPKGQMIIITDGSGLVQEWGQPARAMKKGDVVWTPPGVKHWHGASSTSSLTHIAVQEMVEGKNVNWLEKVSDEQYAASNPESTNKPKAKPGTIDDIANIAPDFVKLTKETLFGDIWKRPPLSPRDKSLVTITILAALNKAEQIDYHLGYGLDNGLTEREVVGALTHTAFYAGWPSAMTGLTHFKNVLDERKAEQK